MERTDERLWAAISAAGGNAAVRLKAPGAVRGVWRGRVLGGRGEWSQGRAAVASQPGVTLVRADRGVGVGEHAYRAVAGN